jgi:hypothetical protein
LVSKGAKKAAAFLVPALIVPGLWLLRCLNVPAAGGYLPLWERYSHKLSQPGDLLLHAARLLWVLGGGMLNADPPGWAAAIIGAGFLWLALQPALRSRKNTVTLAMGLYIGAVMLLHLSWPFESFRYFIPILPILWILTLVETGPRHARRRLVIPGAVLAALAVHNWSVYFPAAGAPPTLWPETMEWIKANTPADAKFQSVYDAPLMLFTGRPAVPFPAGISSRAEWLAKDRVQNVRYVLLNESVAGRIQEGPDFAPIYKNEKEGSRLFELRPDGAGR